VEQKMLSVADVAEMLDVHKRTVRRWINSGKIGAINIGSSTPKGTRYRIPLDAYREFVRERQQDKNE